MKATKKIFDDACRLYDQYTKLIHSENHDEVEELRTMEAYNSLLDEYDFSNEVFTGEDGKEGLRLCTGEILIPARYDKINRFHIFGIPVEDTLAIATRGGKDYLVNSKGEEVLESEALLPCELSLTPVRFKQGGKWGLANRKGQVIIEPRYDKVIPEANGFIFLENDGKEGLVGPWDEYIEPIFDKIELDDDYFIGTLNGKQGYIQRDGTLSEDTDDAISWEEDL